MSIDALRGLDMLIIIGGDRFLRQLGKLLGPQTQALADRQLEHAEWEGFYFYDLIFPLFLFLVGVVLPFSLGKIAASGAPRRAVYLRIVRRTALLFALGLLGNGILNFQWDELRVAGVLQRIALAYGFAAIIYLNTNRLGRIATFAAILLGYWALLAYVAPPGGTAGDYTKEGNLVGWVDRHFLPGKIYEAYYGFGDNEGLLSTIPAIATALLGVFAGEWLRSSRRGGVKVLGLVLTGAACVGLGWYWGQHFPIIKNIWTSSFVLMAGGWSLLALALFYGVIDVVGWNRWAFPLVVIGANAITIYVVPRFVDFNKIADFFLGGAIDFAAAVYQPVLITASVLLAKWVFLWFLYRHRIFLRV
jgi:predicted acyltransferase